MDLTGRSFASIASSGSGSVGGLGSVVVVAIDVVVIDVVVIEVMGSKVAGGTVQGTA